MYLNMMQNYQQTLSHFVGPTEIFVSGDTLQLKDYSKTDWQNPSILIGRPPMDSSLL